MGTRRPPNADSPPASAEMLSRLQPVSKAPARLQQAIRRFRGKQQPPTKVLISLRVAPEVLDRYRATGRGWQARMHADLARAAKRLPRPGS